MRRGIIIAVIAVLLGGCGTSATPPGQEILAANVEQDLKPEQRKALVGVLHMPVVSIAFPDGQGSVEVEVIAARGPRREGEETVADLKLEPAFVRSVLVHVKDAAGYARSAEVIGNPVNIGTADSPIHARLVQITRRKSGLLGKSMAQMTVRASPRGVERL
jgi:hypothetical protein